MTGSPIYAQDLEIGHEFFTDGVTVTEAHVVGFAGLTGDVNQLHMDKAWAETKGPHGARIAHGMLVLSMAGGLRCMLDDLALIGFLGIEEWRFEKPVFLGDTIRAKMVLAKLRPTSKAGRSILSVTVEMLNERAEVVQRGVWTMMILERPT